MNTPQKGHDAVRRLQQGFLAIYITSSLLGIMASIFLITPPSIQADERPTDSTSDSQSMPESDTYLKDSSIWMAGVGEGFRSGTQNLGLSAGATYGALMLGGEEHHHLALLSASYGRMIGAVKGVDSWYRGNWELRGEVLGGMQFNSETSWLIGLTPHVRYNFATGSSWVPYADFGVGVTLTDIHEPDLGGSFQFNLQAIVGVNYFIRDTLAVSFEGRYIHLSSAGIYDPNNGVNSLGIFLGVNTFF